MPAYLLEKPQLAVQPGVVGGSSGGLFRAAQQDRPAGCFAVSPEGNLEVVQSEIAKIGRLGAKPIKKRSSLRLFRGFAAFSGSASR